LEISPAVEKERISYAKNHQYTEADIAGTWQKVNYGKKRGLSLSITERKGGYPCHWTAIAVMKVFFE
jgi:hypothetical protein